MVRLAESRNLGRRCDGKASLVRGGYELGVPADEGGRWPKCERAREVDRVVAAEAELLSELAGLARQFLGDSHGEQFRIDGLEVFQGIAMPSGGEATETSGRRDCRAALRVGEDARCDRVR